jgi:excinuclease ABC subunit A
MKNTQEKMQDYIEIYGAREHNLKNIDLIIPRNKLVVFTGLSGSGKSSLAFDTLFAEGQRRYMESFSAYARQFIGNLERPDVDKIEGLSPVISIEQKTTNRNPRSTVGTVTEVYDFLRLLFARIGVAHSYNTGKPMIKMSEDQILRQIFEQYENEKIAILAPLVRARKGHYRELFEQVRKQGYLKIRIDGEIQDLLPAMQTDRYKTHNIELVIDRLLIADDNRVRLSQSLQTAMKMGKGTIQLMHLETEETAFFSNLLMCAESGIAYDEPQPNTFSFNSPAGACPTCDGLGVLPSIPYELVIPDETLSIKDGGIAAFGEYRDVWTYRIVEKMAKTHKFSLKTPIKDLPKDILKMLIYKGTPNYRSQLSFADNQYIGAFEGVIPMLLRYYKSPDAEYLSRWAEQFVQQTPCQDCGGARLKKESLHFIINEKNIADLSQMDLIELQQWFDTITTQLTDRQLTIAHEIIKEIRERTGFLNDIGLTYLSLNRGSKTLSGGESQRIRLATQIGSQLTGVLYILDEPSIGLHQRDNQRLIQSLKNLRNLGNSVIVVEHDKDMIIESDFVVDIGPGAGKFGGEIVGKGTPKEFFENNTITAQYLNGTRSIATPTERRTGNGNFLVIEGCTGNNLKNLTVTFPLGKFICVSGVSGSGKSTLINETLYPILSQHFYRSKQKPLAYTNFTGIEHIDKVIEIDQSPIGRTPRSNPVTYTGVFTNIRTLYADLPEAKIRGYAAGRFSFNVRGGRCETCGGGGKRVIEMNFMPDVEVICEACNGKRYNRETVEVRFKGKSINDILNMSIDDAVVFFENQPAIVRKIKTLQDVGLGYITLGQSSTTLSGGEAQRVKLATELSKRDTGKTFYILDEPTTGLHFEDVRVLLGVLQKLADKGNTVLVIEHNLDVMKVADHIIDIGIEGGKNGGNLLFEGTPEQMIANTTPSHTAKYLKIEMEEIRQK